MQSHPTKSILFLCLVCLIILGFLHWKALEFRGNAFEYASTLSSRVDDGTARSLSLLRKLLPAVNEPITLPVLIKLIEKVESVDGVELTIEGVDPQSKQFNYEGVYFLFDDKGFLERVMVSKSYGSSFASLPTVSSAAPSTSYVFGSRPLVGYPLYSITILFLGTIYLFAIFLYLLAELKHHKRMAAYSKQILISLLFLTFCALFFNLFQAQTFNVDGFIQHPYWSLNQVIEGAANILVFPSLLMDFCLVVFLSTMWVEYRLAKKELSQV